jgi:hypothetical protein
MVQMPSRGEDMGTGLITLYGGNPSSPPDVSVSLYKYLGTDGEYSTHQRTMVAGLFTSEPVDSFVDPDGGIDPRQTVFNVMAGQWLVVEFTFENNGLNSIRSLATDIVLSSNRIITSLDRVLFEANVPFTRNTPLTRAFLVRVPPELTSGTRWYIGAIVDAHNTIAEFDKRNNATYFPVQIR